MSFFRLANFGIVSKWCPISSDTLDSGTGIFRFSFRKGKLLSTAHIPRHPSQRDCADFREENQLFEKKTRVGQTIKPLRIGMLVHAEVADTLQFLCVSNPLFLLGATLELR